MGSSVTPEREQAHAVKDSSPAPAVADTPELASIRALWQGARCGNPSEADARLTALLGAEGTPAPTATEALALRGLARSELGMKEEAFDDLTAAVRQQPVPRNYAWRSLALWRAGNGRGARTDAQYALRKDKSQTVAHMVLGLTELQDGDTAMGCAKLRTACEAGECSGLEEARAGGQCPR